MLSNGEFLRGAADAGDLRVNPIEAQQAVEKLAKVKHKLEALQATMNATSSDVKLQMGANTVGIAMSNKSQDKTNGGESLHAAVQILLTQATNAHYAVKKAMENYDYTDESGARRFRPQH